MTRMSVSAVGKTPQNDSSTGTCLVDRALSVGVKAGIDCHDSAQYSCLSVDYAPQAGANDISNAPEQCVTGIFERTLCLKIERVSDLQPEGEETPPRDYNCFHSGILQRGGLRLIGQAETLEDSLKQSVQRCEELKKAGSL